MLLLTAVAALAAILACLLSALAWRAASGAAGGGDPRMPARLEALVQAVERAPRELREEHRGQRDEDRSAHAGHVNAIDARLDQLGQALERRLAAFAQGQEGQLSSLRGESAAGREQAEAALKRNVDSFAEVQRTKLDDTARAMGELAARLERQQQAARDGQREALEGASAAQKTALDEVNRKIETLLNTNERRQASMQEQLTTQLDKLRQENSAELDKMRATVDEKLQGTLEKRLGESFQIVSDRLETVHRSMGEMQTLAADVGGLKRVMTNVKSRGTWGEVQLGALLEDLLRPEQYGRQVAVQKHGDSRVDYAVYVPRPGDEPMLVPIDCKFPQEDYERLLNAQESGDAALVDAAGKALEQAIRVQAKSISEKYIRPPVTSDVAFMYLPTESLFAEVVRRPGLISLLQQVHGIIVAGPTTLSSVLSSFRMLLQTIAIQERSNEVRQLLGEAKRAFQDYGTALDAVDKALDGAKKKVADVGVRHRAVTRRLRDVEVEALPGPPPALVLTAPEPEEQDQAA